MKREMLTIEQWKEKDQKLIPLVDGNQTPSV